MESNNHSNQPTRSPLYDAVRKVFYATVGAGVLAAEEVSKLLDSLAERGKAAQAAEEQRYRQAREAARAAAQAEATSPAAEMPVAEDLEALAERRARLQAELEALQRQQEPLAGPEGENRL